MKASFALRPLHLALLACLALPAVPALAACTASDNSTCTSTLADTPLPVVSSVAPNILFMIDASGSMYSIVPDTPYDNAVTYLNCNAAPAVNQFGDDFASPISLYTVSEIYSLSVRKSNGEVWITTTNGEPSNTPSSSDNFKLGTTGSAKCFKQDKWYRATLNAYNIGSNFNYANQYPGAVYTGNYLNWYFSAANFPANATRKPGTQSRMDITQAAATGVVNSLDKVRAGLFTYTFSGEGGRLVREIGDLSSIRSNLISDIANLSSSTYMPTNGTPLANTLADIGKYFTLGGSGNLTLYPTGTPYAGTSSAQSVSTVFPANSAWSGTPSAPIQYFCQKNFAVLMTDGMSTNDRTPNSNSPVSSYLREYAGYCASNPTNCRASTAPYGYGMRKARENGTNPDGSTWEYYESDGTSGPPNWTANSQPNYSPSDYLDDVAATLYDIDLRPDLSGKQNVTTYTIGLADPVLQYTTLLSRTASKGGGLFQSASNSAQLVAAFQAATDDILAKDGSASAVAVANAHVTNSDNASYATSYNSGSWTGDVIAYPINTNTGVPNINAPIWDAGCSNPNALVDPTDASKGVLGCSAQVQLDTKVPSSRVIFTSNDTSTCRANCGIPFQPNNLGSGTTAGVDKLSTTQRDRLRTPTSASTFNADGDAVVSYLRGDRAGESAGTYRSRTHILGDTVDAEPVVVSEPNLNYIDLGYGIDWCTDGTSGAPTCTATANPSNFRTAFKTANENRPRIIIQPANDGMVHAFNSVTTTTPYALRGGDEAWAYVPDLLISSVNDPGNSATSVLNTRTRKASFNHYYMIDATPIAGDVDFDKTGSTPAGTSPNAQPNWKTIVVGGLGKGGRGYYALDVTTTAGTSVTENAANAAEKVLWEFPRSIVNATDRAAAQLNIGYTFGKPIITKTAAAGWVVLATSGYNNGADSGQTSLTGSTATTDGGGDGYGHLYVINAKTGDLIKDIATPQCNTAVTVSATNSKLYPCGLTHINGYVEDRDTDNTTTYVYAGDLYGNVWRFNLTGSSTSAWSVTKLAVLRSGSAATDPVQPITSTPELAKVESPAGSGTYYYYVYVGTGRYLDKIDLPCPPSPATCAWTPNANVTQTQSMYGLIDPRPASPTSPILPDPLRGSLLAQTFNTPGCTTTTAGCTTTSTNTNIALTGGSAKKGWVLDFTNGERIVTDPTLAAGTLVFTSNQPSTEACTPGGNSWLYAVDYQDGGLSDGAGWSRFSLGNALTSRPVLIQTPDGKIYALTRTSDGRTVSTLVPISATADVGRRISWRELFDK